MHMGIGLDSPINGSEIGTIPIQVKAIAWGLKVILG
jgi:hypothetical protein